MGCPRNQFIPRHVLGMLHVVHIPMWKGGQGLMRATQLISDGGGEIEVCGMIVEETSQRQGREICS